MGPPTGSSQRPDKQAVKEFRTSTSKYQRRRHAQSLDLQNAFRMWRRVAAVCGHGPIQLTLHVVHPATRCKAVCRKSRATAKKKRRRSSQEIYPEKLGLGHPHRPCVLCLWYCPLHYGWPLALVLNIIFNRPLGPEIARTDFPMRGRTKVTCGSLAYSSKRC